MRTCARLAILALFATGCVTAAPIFEDDVQKSFAETPMRRLETPSLLLYYPAFRQDEALKFAAGVEDCVGKLRRKAPVEFGKLLVYFTEAPYNNAYVAPNVAGMEQRMLVPTSFSWPFLSDIGINPSPWQVACHESVHATMFQQESGGWALVNTLFGNILNPQIGFDSWFHEGMATFYESELVPNTGRMAAPFWNGVWHAGVAGTHIDGGDFNDANRRTRSPAYVYGSQFVKWLHDAYGEEKLWDVTGVQGRSVFFFTGVNVRFWQAYDKSLSTLIDEFDAYAKRQWPVIPRPADQQLVEDVGTAAHVATSPDGSMAILTEDYDLPARLRVFGPDGKLRVSKSLSQLLPPREVYAYAVGSSGGLSMTADGSQVFFAVMQRGNPYNLNRLVKVDVKSKELSLVGGDLHGMGGSISPDGRRYYFTRSVGNRGELAVVDVATGRIDPLYVFPVGTYLDIPRVSPDGLRIAAPVSAGATWDLWLFDAASGRPLRALTTSAVTHRTPWWLDDRTLVYVANEGGKLQVFAEDVESGRSTQLTHAPYLAYEPVSASDGRSVLFLNRDGWKWTLDRVALPQQVVGQLSLSVGPASLPAAGTEARTTYPRPPFASSPDSIVPQGELPSPQGGRVAGVGSNEQRGSGPGSERGPGPEPGPAPEPTPGPSPHFPDRALEASLPPATIESDAPYSPLDHLFVPQLHAPFLSVTSSATMVLGLALGGSDRLSLHRWIAWGSYGPAAKAVSFGVSYANAQLAPFVITADVQQNEDELLVTNPDTADTDKPDLPHATRERVASLSVSRALYDSAAVSASFLGIESLRPFPGCTLEKCAPLPTRAVGPRVDATFGTVEPAPYIGARRALSLDLSGAAFPRQLGTDFTFSDLAGTVGGRMPIPLGRRHTLGLKVRGRFLLGDLGDRRLLRVGGQPFGVTLGGTKPLDVPNPDEQLPPQLSFVEPLRGYENLGFDANRVGLGEVTWRYPVIFDVGSASSLVIGPSVFLRQLNFEAFVSAATTFAKDRHAAGGGSIGVQFLVWRIPNTLRYQLARRFDDDRALVHAVALAIGQ